MSISAKKSLGQNFIIDDNICRKIVSALNLNREDTVLEIGPGRGALTGLLLQQTGRVYALEKDLELCRELSEYLPDLNLVCADATHFDWARLSSLPRLKLIGNLPYNIASRLIWDIASQGPAFFKAVFMVQKEVGQRIVSLPGSRSYGSLSVWVQSFLQPKMLFKVPPTVFRPRPKVDSTVLSLMPLADEKKIFSSDSLSRTLKILFQNRRKQMGTILKTYWNNEVSLFFEERGISPCSRPEELTAHDFQALSRAIFLD